jgi:hypothetical protein
MPKWAKLAEFFQGHFIRFWDRGQAGNGACEGELAYERDKEGDTGLRSLDGTYATDGTYGSTSY